MMVTQYWTVRYDDNDTEDIKFNDFKTALDLHKLYPDSYRFSNDEIATLTDGGSKTHRNSDQKGNHGDANNTGLASSTMSRRSERSHDNINTRSQLTNDHNAPAASDGSETNICSGGDQRESPTDANNDNTGFTSSTMPRRSERIRNKLKRQSQQSDNRAACLAKRAFLGAMGVAYYFNSTVAPDSFANTAQSSLVDIVTPPVDTSHKNLLSNAKYVELVTESIDQIEKLQAYHAQVDKLNHLLSPNLYPTTDPTIEIDRHYVRPISSSSTTSSEKCQIMLSTRHPHSLTHNRTLTALDDLRVEYPWECIAYAQRDGLRNKEGWEWIEPYIASDPLFAKIVHTYRASQTEANKYQYGVQVPKSAKHAFKLDEANGDKLWTDSMAIELQQILHDFNAFRILDDNKAIPQGYKKVPYHFTFAVRVDLRQKSRLIIDGNRSPEQPKEDCFASVVSAEAVQLGLILANIHGLQCVAGDVGNAYLTAYTTEKLYIVAGPEFGEYEGKRMLVTKSIYGTRIGGACFHASLSARLRHFGFKPSTADPDLWLRNTDYGYEYIARYVDDVICFSKDPKRIMTYLSKYYTMKGVGYPQFYLGGDILEMPESWNVKYAMSSKTYINNYVDNLERMCSTYFAPCSTPFYENYYPEEDTSDLHSPPITSFLLISHRQC